MLERCSSRLLTEYQLLFLIHQEEQEQRELGEHREPLTADEDDSPDEDETSDQDDDLERLITEQAAWLATITTPSKEPAE